VTKACEQQDAAEVLQAILYKIHALRKLSQHELHFTVKCNCCKNVSTRAELNTMVNVEIDGMETLQAAVNAFSTTEQLQGENN